MIDQAQILKAAEQLKSAEKIVFVTGAGISKESGIPTYREPQTGLWSKYDPMELGTPEGFMENPKLVWDWNEYRRHEMNKVQPNPGHFAIAELQKMRSGVSVITQNIDGLHQRAGSTGVIELHGTIHRQKCFSNCQGNPTRLDVDTIEKRSPEGVPLCPYCGGFARPDIVWFHEPLPPVSLDQAYSRLDAANVAVTVGTSGAVWPAAGFASRAKDKNNAFHIDINPVESPISKQADLHVAAPSGEALPLIVQAMKETQ